MNKRRYTENSMDKGNEMAGTYKIVELVGTSPISFAEAVKSGIRWPDSDYKRATPRAIEESVNNLSNRERTSVCRGGKWPSERLGDT